MNFHTHPKHIIRNTLIALSVISGISILIFCLTSCKPSEIVTTTSEGWKIHGNIQNDSTIYLK